MCQDAVRVSMFPGLKPTPIEIALALATQLEMRFLSSVIKIRAEYLWNDVATKLWKHMTK